MLLFMRAFLCAKMTQRLFVRTSQICTKFDNFWHTYS